MVEKIPPDPSRATGSCAPSHVGGEGETEGTQPDSARLRPDWVGPGVSRDLSEAHFSQSGMESPAGCLRSFTRKNLAIINLA